MHPYFVRSDDYQVVQPQIIDEAVSCLAGDRLGDRVRYPGPASRVRWLDRDAPACAAICRSAGVVTAGLGVDQLWPTPSSDGKVALAVSVATAPQWSPPSNKILSAALHLRRLLADHFGG